MKLIIGWIIVIIGLVCFKECSAKFINIGMIYEDDIKPHRMTYQRDWSDVLDNSTLVFDIASAENSVKKGWIDGKWYPHPSVEGGNPTIAYGHKLTDEEYKSGIYLDGITDIRAYRLLIQDIEKAVRTIKMDPMVWNQLSWQQKYLLIDFQFNLGNVVGKFPKFTKAVLNKDRYNMLRQYKRYYRDAKGDKYELKDRNERTKRFIIQNF